MDTGIGNTPSITGIYFNCPTDQRAEFIQAWAGELLKEARAKGLDMDSPNAVLLSVSLEACGGQATYRTADDIPLEDVPCPCGDPNHWLISWRRAGST